jgi:hypothetical protein
MRDLNMEKGEVDKLQSNYSFVRQKNLHKHDSLNLLEWSVTP